MMWKVFRRAASLVGQGTGSFQYAAVNRSDSLGPVNDWPENPQNMVTGKTKDAGLRYLVALTCGVGGLQVVWSVVLSNGTPYLISLGLSKSLTALVWMAAPLCGMFVQPVMGILSDYSRFSWGRRRPFIVGGTVGAVASMLTLAWISQLVEFISSHFHILGPTKETLTLFFAIVLVYCLNFSIQPIQMGLRVLIVENCPKHQQSQASAWATYLTSCGNILGYICGFSILPKLLHLPQITQFQSLCMIASLSLTLTVTISCYFITENGSQFTQPDRANPLVSLLSLRRVIQTANMMPVKVRKACQIQFFAWMAWFPFLYYSATYVGELYIAAVLTQDPTMTARQESLLRKESTHIGTLASLLFAIVAFLSNIVLSSLIQQSKPGTARVTRRSPVSGDSEFSIARAWMCAHLWFATSMFATVFITSWAGGAVLIAYVGISWAMTLWAPFSIIGEEMVAMNRSQDGDDQMGVIMSLHNVAISAPQVVAAITSSGLFWIARVLEYQDSTGLVLRVGAFAALAAAYLTWKLEE